MKQTMPWFDRGFEFSLPLWMFPNVVERIRGTPARLEELVGNLTAEVRIHKNADAWSIQEHTGHLVDLEPLWSGRVDDLLTGAQELRPADLVNTKTERANHNAQGIHQILADFRKARAALASRLDGLDEDTVGRSARHPRLDQPMRLIDLVFFVAEHDDHHLARMREEIKAITSGPKR